MTVKNFNFKNPRWRTAAILKIEKSGYHMMMQNGSFQHIGTSPPWVVETEIL